MEPRRRQPIINRAIVKGLVNALPPVTIVIEWENAIDVDDNWTGTAMAALERELTKIRPNIAQEVVVDDQLEISRRRSALPG